jgi:hypothetical protein
VDGTYFLDGNETKNHYCNTIPMAAIGLAVRLREVTVPSLRTVKEVNIKIGLASIKQR